MKPQDKLKAWMDENGYNSSALAQELGFSYNYIFKILAGLKPLGSGFKYKFLVRFGRKEADKVFDATLQREPA